MSQAEFRSETSLMFQRLAKQYGPVKTAVDMYDKLLWDERNFEYEKEEMCDNVTDMYFSSHLADLGIDEDSLVRLLPKRFWKSSTNTILFCPDS